MAKKIQVSNDGGSTWADIPGPSGSMSRDGEQIDDTILGQAFQSQQPGLISWSTDATGYYKGFPGYHATIKEIGASSTSVTGGAMSQENGQTYRIDNAAHEIWDQSATTTIYDNGAQVADSNIESIDYLFGRVTFVSGYTVTGPVTADFSYYATNTVGKGRQISLSQTANPVDNTDLPTAQANNGFRTYEVGLRTVAVSLSGVYDAASGFFTALKNRDETILEINPDGNSQSVARGYFKPSSQSQSGNVGALEDEEVQFVLSVQSADVTPFAWDHAAATTLADSLMWLLDAWEGGTTIDARYLPDGSTGYQGTAVPTDVSMNVTLDGMVEFSANLQGSGELNSV
jgi:hypothetical protein